MATVTNWLLPETFLPQGHCYLWRPDVLWLHVGSDAIIATSYYAIPLALAYFVRRRRAVLPYWWVPTLFAMFIFLCGTTHLLNIWTVWKPDYIVDGVVKLATGIASAATAVMIFAALPRALALRTPIELQREVDARTHELMAVNARLREEIQARERTEAALRENELRVRLALEAARAATWTIDFAHDGRERFDARGCELAGLDGQQGEWPSGSFCRLLHPEDGELMRRAAEQTHAHSGPGPIMEYRIVRSDGEVRWLQGAGIVQRDEAGRSQLFIGVSLDITDRKRLEEELRRTIERLAETDRRKDEFLATLAHELRNPLAPIANGVQLIKLTNPSLPTVRRAIEMMERQMQHLVRLVDDLLDVSRIARGKAPLRREPLALEQVLQGALESAWSDFDRERLELIVQRPGQPIVVEGDRDRLTQVFANILSNAAKYCEERGTVWVKISQENGQAAVSIRDTGIGIPPEALEKVFEMFSQLRQPGYDAGGLGIGLALVRQLVQLHGGTVEARSAGEGHGSEFMIRLPLASDTSAVPTEGPDPLQVRMQQPIRAPQPMRVMVVDDNRDSAESLQALLRMMGHEVQEAADGIAALEAVATFDPQVIFMDIGMPRMSGLEAAASIRAMALSRQPLIVALTGWGQEADRERSARAGIDHHLVKPIGLEALQAVFSLRPRDTGVAFRVSGLPAGNTTGPPL